MGLACGWTARNSNESQRPVDTPRWSSAPVSWRHASLACSMCQSCSAAQALSSSSARAPPVATLSSLHSS